MTKEQRDYLKDLWEVAYEAAAMLHERGESRLAKLLCLRAGQAVGLALRLDREKQLLFTEVAHRVESAT